MYGLLIEGVCEYLRERFGEENWLLIQKKSEIQTLCFSTHKVYDEKYIPQITTAASEIVHVDRRELLEKFGIYFVGFTSKYGYDRILRVLGRHMRDFLNGLDNLHEYIRFSYPHIRPPSFFASEETRHGLTLLYRSKRQGFIPYIIGQLKEVGRVFYSVDINVEIISRGIKSNNTFYAVLRLHFDNTAFKYDLGSRVTIKENLHIKSDEFFELFPFSFVFDPDMIIRHEGPKISAVLPNITGKNMTEVFSLTRPIVSFTWDDIIVHTNNIFELASVDRVNAKAVNARLQTVPSDGSNEHLDNIIKFEDFTCPKSEDKESVCTTNSIEEQEVKGADSGEISDGEDSTCLKPRRLYLRGQMKYMAAWNCMVYLCAPLMPNLEAMFRTGIFINDLSLHDSSRALALIGTQQSAQLKLALDREQLKSAKLEESMRQLDREMKKTDSLLYQMIPKQVADRLRRGEPAMNTCEVFHDVSILFSDVVGFTQICSAITPMAVVSMLNTIYSKFDALIEKNKVYKVETIGDAYMVVSGAPTKTKYHAEHIADMALDMVTCMRGLKEPASGDSMKIRIGIHSGMVVAGVVGIKMPRYCLFGDTVNTASRMESSGEAMKIHVSETTKDYLKNSPYDIMERGIQDVKSKGQMKTYWLESKRSSQVSKQTSQKKTWQGQVQEFPENMTGGSFLSPPAGGEYIRRLSRDEIEEYQKDFPMSAVRPPCSNPTSPGGDWPTQAELEQILRTRIGSSHESDAEGESIADESSNEKTLTYCDLDYFLSPVTLKATSSAGESQSKTGEGRPPTIGENRFDERVETDTEMHDDHKLDELLLLSTNGEENEICLQNGCESNENQNDVVIGVLAGLDENGKFSSSQSVTCGLI